MSGDEIQKESSTSIEECRFCPAPGKSQSQDREYKEIVT
jgi:hypothetical protein